MEICDSAHSVGNSVDPAIDSSGSDGEKLGFVISNSGVVFVATFGVNVLKEFLVGVDVGKMDGINFILEGGEPGVQFSFDLSSGISELGFVTGDEGIEVGLFYYVGNKIIILILTTQLGVSSKENLPASQLGSCCCGNSTKQSA